MKPQTKVLNFIKEEINIISRSVFITAGDKERETNRLIRIADKINEVFE